MKFVEKKSIRPSFIFCSHSKNFFEVFFFFLRYPIFSCKMLRITVLISLDRDFHFPKQWHDNKVVVILCQRMKISKSHLLTLKSKEIRMDRGNGRICEKSKKTLQFGITLPQANYHHIHCG